MPKVKSGNWKHVTVLSESEQKLQCVYCSKVYSGGVLRIRSHLLGNNSMKKCKSVPSDVISSLTGEIKMKTEAKLLWQTKQSLHEATTSGASTSTSSGIPIPGSSSRHQYPKLFRQVQFRQQILHLLDFFMLLVFRLW